MAETRTFTSSDGKEIEAELVAVIEGKATLKVGGEKTFVVPLERLSDADREFVQEWAKTNKSYKLTDLRFAAKKVRKTERSKAEKNKKASKSSKVTWEGTLQNNTREPIDEIVISYTIYNRYYRKSEYSTRRTIDEVEGSDEVGSIGAGEVYEFESDLVEEFDKVEAPKGDSKGSTERQSVLGAVFRVSVGGKELFSHEDPRGILDKIEDEREREREKEEREAGR